MVKREPRSVTITTSGAINGQSFPKRPIADSSNHASGQATITTNCLKEFNQ